MLDDFADWFTRNENRLRRRGVHIAVTRPSERGDKNSIYADLDADRFIGRVTLWDSGECDKEILSIDTETTVLWEHSILKSPAELDLALTDFCERLASARFENSV